MHLGAYPTDLINNHPVIYLATNGRRRWGICRPLHTKGFFLYECSANWDVIRKERFKTIQEAMDSGQLAENIPLVWIEVKPQRHKKYMSRELTDQERGWLVSGLKSLSEEQQAPPLHRYYISAGRPVIDEPDELIDPKPLLDQIDGLRVVSECGCGQASCNTVQFQHYEPGKVETIVTHHTDDGRWLVIDINEETGFIAQLEVI